MIHFKPRNEIGYLPPPNCKSNYLMHPSGERNETIELAVFNEHRFAFNYWLNWNKKHKFETPPDLISFDWHQDLIPPADLTKKELEDLDLDNNFEVSFFTWARLNQLNDDHILAAAYLNQINDIWVVCKQEQFGTWNDEEIIDFKGNKHTVRKFKNKDSLYNALIQKEISNIYFDIDLDYFTIENISSSSDRKFTYMDDKEIDEIFSVDSKLMKWLFKRMSGFTIALEPSHTGGISKSLKYLSLLNEILFEGEINTWECEWKHLQ